MEESRSQRARQSHLRPEQASPPTPSTFTQPLRRTMAGHPQLSPSPSGPAAPIQVFPGNTETCPQEDRGLLRTKPLRGTTQCPPTGPQHCWAARRSCCEPSPPLPPLTGAESQEEGAAMRLHKPAGSCPRPARPVRTQGHPTRPGRWEPSPARTQRLVGMVTGRSPWPEAPTPFPGHARHGGLPGRLESRRACEGSPSRGPGDSCVVQGVRRDGVTAAPCPLQP